MTRRWPSCCCSPLAALSPRRATRDRSTSARGRERIVSLIPAVTEMIYAMGDGARVAAVSNYDHFPADVATPAARRRAARSERRAHPRDQAGPGDRLRDPEGADRAARSRRHSVLQLPAQGAARHHDDDPRDRRAHRIRRAAECGGRPDMERSLGRDSREDRRAAATRRRCWCSSAIRRRCATSTRAAATASCTTCWRSPADATSSRTSSSRRCRRARRCSSPASPT